MRCTNPMRRDGDGSIRRKPAHLDSGVPIRCGNCVACRLTEAAGWAVRATHEASMYAANCTLLLTYAPEHLPPDLGLRREHTKLFEKRLRKHLSPTRIKFLMCGEYGDENKRPHYHYALMGHAFPDRTYLTRINGRDYYQSRTLTRLWPYGHANIGEMSYDSVAYIARYVTKKIKGHAINVPDPVTGLKPYERANQQTGEVWTVEPEFRSSSRRPGGLGYTWFRKYWRDLYPGDTCPIMVNGKSKLFPIPRYYDRLLERHHPEVHAKVKSERDRKGRESSVCLAELHREGRARDAAQSERRPGY